MEALRLHWLGTPLVELKGRAVRFETRKAVALLAYASLRTGECSREMLATLFWPEKNQQKALGNLRRTLSSLHASLPGWIQADRETISVNSGHSLWMDLDIFRQAIPHQAEHVHSGDEACDECLAGLTRALDAYRGDFLEGLNLDDCPSFDEWQLFERDGLRQELAAVLQRLSAAYAARAQWEQAIPVARRWVALDRLYEPACRNLMDLYARSNQRVLAIRQYEEFARSLREQIGQEPEAQTRQLFEQIRRQEDINRAVPSLERPTSLPLLKTKLYVPSKPASGVIRGHLMERMNELASKPLTLISAPAGFGKTTLLAEWIARSAMPVAWLSLDHGDNDTQRFLAYLIAALESIREDVGEEAQRIMQSGQAVPPHIVIGSLINELGKVTKPFALVLDDAQFITNGAVHEALGYLLDHLPPSLHLVISTRADPPLQLGRMRAHGQMLELRTQDLRFTPEEAAQFLNEVMQLELLPGEIEALQSRTEGWVVGLKMAALSLSQREDAGEFIKNFSGSQRYVLDYLVEEVLRRQPQPIQEFLLKTSVLDKLSGPLCDSLMKRQPAQPGESGQDLLEYLERSNLFVMPLDDHKQWYRYHHLFADLLRTQLLRSLDAQGIAELHARASDWYGESGLALDAIQHAFMSADDERAERWIEKSYLEMVRRGEMTGLRYWTDRLSKDLVYRRPQLCIYAAYSRCWFGELDEADIFVEAAEKRLRSGTAAPETDAMLGHLLYVKTRITAMRGDLPRAIEYNLAAREYLSASNVALQLDMGITLGYLYFLNGDYPPARHFLEETVRSGKATGAILNTVAGYCLLARLYANQGHLRQSYGIYQEAAQWIQEIGGEHLGASSLVEVGMADVLCEWNDLDSARAHVERGLASIHLWGKVDDLILACLTQARIELAQADLNAATAAMQKALQAMQAHGLFPEAPHAMELAQAKLWLAQGDIQAASRWAASMEQRFCSGDPFGYENEVTHIARTRAWIAENKLDEAIDLLSRLEENARSGERMGRVIEILLLSALARWQRDDPEGALLALTDCLALAGPEGYMRIFLDEGEPLFRLLEQARASGRATEHKEYMDKLLAGYRRRTGVPA